MGSHAENQDKPIYKKGWFWAIIIVLIILIGGTASTQKTDPTSNSSEAKQAEKKEEEILEVDYNVLHQEYQENAIAADAKYKGKILKLTGPVDDINREIAGNPYITFKVGDQYSFKNVRITFKKAEEQKVSTLKKGQSVTIKGKCTGLLLTTTVSLNDCEIMM